MRNDATNWENLVLFLKGVPDDPRNRPPSLLPKQAGVLFIFTSLEA